MSEERACNQGDRNTVYSRSNRWMMGLLAAVGLSALGWGFMGARSVRGEDMEFQLQIRDTVKAVQEKMGQAAIAGARTEERWRSIDTRLERMEVFFMCGTFSPKARSPP